MPAPGPTITDILTAATQPGHAHRRAVLGAAPAWLVQIAKSYGLNIEGFRFTLDTSSVRHILAKHGDQKTETPRGQIAVTSADITRIGEIITSPNKIVFGISSKRGQPFIGYLKMNHGVWFSFVVEVRTGRRELAAVTLYKHPATRDAGNIVANFRLDGRTDSGAVIHIVDFPTNVTGADSANTEKHPAAALSGGSATTVEPNGRTDGGNDGVISDPAPAVTNPVIASAAKQSRTEQPDSADAGKHPARTNANTIAGTLESNGRTGGGDAANIPHRPIEATRLHRLAQILPPALGILVLIAVIFGLHGALSKIGPRDVLAALAATSAAQLTHAACLLAVSFVIMLAYDVPGILFAAKLPVFPRLAARRIGFASFCAYALSHVLGAPALSAAAIRVRLYAQWGAPPAGIARIIALSGTSFALGATTLFGLLLLGRPADLPLPGNNLSTLALRAIGAGLCAAIVAYAIIAQTRPSLTLFGRAIPLPGRALAVAQIILSSADIAVAATILYVVLPAAPGLTPAHVLAIYLAAFAAGLVSSLPAGVGVFDTLLLLGLAPYMPAADAIGAILLFRVLYYLAPATAAGLAFAVHEVLLTAKKR